MDKLPYIPDIAIASYLGESKQMREYRLSQHIKQRTVLKECFPEQKILTITSAYSKAEKKQMADLGFDCHHLKERTLHWKKHSLILSTLYASPTLRATLILDDDCIPAPYKDTDSENGLVNTAELLQFWLTHPAQIPGHLLYFACKGLKFDAFYLSEPSIIGKAPIMVTGWAFLVRSDLRVLHEDFTNPRTGRYIAPDFPFRVQCEAEGKQVVKHYRAFMKSLQGTEGDSEKSTCYASREERNRDIQDMLRMLRIRYPQVFNKGKKQEPRRNGLGLLGSKE